MNEFRSVLAPEPQPLWLGCIGSLALHVLGGGAVLLTLLFADALWPKKPLIDPDDTIAVSMVVLPKSPTKMVQKAERIPVKNDPVPEPKVETPPTEAPGTPDVPKPEPEPPKVSDLKVKKKDAPKKVGEAKPKDRSSEREKALAEMKRKQAIQDAMAAAGKTNRHASDPKSKSTEAINTSGIARRSDPEWAKFQMRLEKLYKGHFHPLPTVTQSNPGIYCIMSIKYNPKSLAVTGKTFKRKSNNNFYDGACQRAVDAVRRIPRPPQKYSSFTSFTVKLVPPK